MKNVQSKIEKATLGDLGVLAEIKEKMKQAEEENKQHKSEEGDKSTT